MTDLPPLRHVLTLDCCNIQWTTPVYGFLGSTINQSINQSILLNFIIQNTMSVILSTHKKKSQLLITTDMAMANVN